MRGLPNIACTFTYTSVNYGVTQGSRGKYEKLVFQTAKGMAKMEKSNYFLKTAEFAEFCGTTKDTILWYDKCGILKPSAIDEKGYRFLLKQSGSSIREIRNFIEGKEQISLQDYYEEKSKSLSEMIDEITRMKQLVDAISDNIRTAASCEHGCPKIVYKEEAPMVLTKVRAEESWMYGNEENCLYEHFKTYSSRPDVCRYPIGSIITKESFLNGECIDKFLFSEMAEKSAAAAHCRPAGYYIQIYHKGRLDKVLDTFQIVKDYISANRLILSGDIYEYDILTFLLNSRDNCVFEFLFPVSGVDRPINGA